MAEKTLKSRVLMKNDTAENWAKAENFIPKKGEIIVYNENPPKIKVGNGSTNVNDLPFIASDVGWYGKNFIEDVRPFEAGMSGLLGGNRGEGILAKGITAEYSNDGGKTWTAYGDSDDKKRCLVTGVSDNALYYLGKNSSTAVFNDQLRITIEPISSNTYFLLKSINLLVSGGNRLNCVLEAAKGATGATSLSDLAFSKVGEYQCYGWSGWNTIPYKAVFGQSWTKTANTVAIRLTFKYWGTSVSIANSPESIFKIFLMGTTSWQNANTMGATGHIYKYDINYNATFPNKITATNGIYSNGNVVVRKNDYPQLAIQNTSGTNLINLYSNTSTGDYSDAKMTVYNSASAGATYTFSKDGYFSCKGLTPQTPLGIDYGGTGATTAEGARTNLGITSAITSAIDDVKIGGTNLYRGTKDFSNDASQPWLYLDAWETDEKYRDFTVLKRAGSWSGVRQDIPAVAGEVYTLSAYIKADDGATGVRFYNGAPSGGTGYGTTSPSEIELGEVTSEWKRFSQRFTVTESGLIRPCFLKNTNSTTAYLYICGIKLERGNKATDWSPAPEDNIAYVDNIEIGGRNLLLGTNQGISNWSPSLDGGTFDLSKITYYGASGAHLLVTEDAGSWAYFAYRKVNLNVLEPDSDYILSFNARANKTTYVTVRLVKADSTSPITNSKTISFTKDTWKHYTIPFHTVSSMTIDNQVLFFNLKSAGGTLGTSGSVLSIVNIKLEKGNKATAWSPAPEDMATTNALAGYLPLGGGTLTGTLTAGTSLCVKGNNYPGLLLKNANGANLASLYADTTTGAYSDVKLRVYADTDVKNDFIFGASSGTFTAPGTITGNYLVSRANSYPAMRLEGINSNATLASLTVDTTAGSYGDLRVDVYSSESASVGYEFRKDGTFWCNALEMDTALSIANGGTGATTASGALSNLGALPLSGGTMTGALTISKTAGFTYSGIQNATDNVARNVWFSDSGAIGRPVYNDKLKFNPSSGELTVGGDLTSSGVVRGTALRVYGTNDYPSIYFKCNSKTNYGIMLQASVNHGFGVYCYGKDLDSASTRYYEGYCFPDPATGLTANKNYTIYSTKNVIYSSSQPSSPSTGTIWLKPV